MAGKDLSNKDIAAKFNLLEDDVADFKNVFIAYDQDDSGTISAGEFKDLMKSLELEDEAAKRFMESDTDGHPGLTFEEFMGYMQNHTPSEIEVVRRLGRVDRDGDGKITKQELTGLFDGAWVSGGRLERTFQEFDMDGDGEITVAEFLKTYVAYKKEEASGDFK